MQILLVVAPVTHHFALVPLRLDPEQRIIVVSSGDFYISEIRSPIRIIGEVEGPAVKQGEDT